MKRLPFLLAGFLFATLFGWQSCLMLVREPSHPRASSMDNDYPLESGLIWVYKGGMGLQVVRRVGPRPEGPYKRMHYELPVVGAQNFLMRRTPEGVIGLREGREQLIMRFPMNKGDSWTIDFPEQDLAECTVLDPEEIGVMGERKTASKLKIVRTNRKSGRKTTDYEWYVRGIGLARMQVTFGLTAVFELERFEHIK